MDVPTAILILAFGILAGGALAMLFTPAHDWRPEARAWLLRQWGEAKTRKIPAAALAGAIHDLTLSLLRDGKIK